MGNAVLEVGFFPHPPTQPHTLTHAHYVVSPQALLFPCRAGAHCREQGRLLGATFSCRDRYCQPADCNLQYVSTLLGACGVPDVPEVHSICRCKRFCQPRSKCRTHCREWNTGVPKAPVPPTGLQVNAGMSRRLGFVVFSAVLNLSSVNATWCVQSF